MTTRNQILAFSLLCLASIVFWWHPLVATLGLALHNEAYTHILLIFPLSIAFAYSDRKNWQRRSERGLVAGLVVLVAAVLLALLGQSEKIGLPADARLTVLMFALVIWWIGSTIFCFGVATFRTFLFPLGFLFLIVPIPDLVLSPIIEFLQQQSAVAAHMIFRAAGVPVTQDGTMLYIPNLAIEVAPECSSIRSSLLLLVTTMVLAQSFLRSWWRKALLVVVAIPLSVAKNGLRIFVIGELGTRVDPGFLTGRFHRNGGIIFFGIAAVAEVALLWILRRTEVRNS